MSDHYEGMPVYALDLSYQRQPKRPTRSKIVHRAMAEKYGKLISVMAVLGIAGMLLPCTLHV